MILADTSVWIDFIHGKSPDLQKLLIENKIVLHPMIIGELRCGKVKNRAHFFESLENINCIEEINNLKVYHMIESFNIMGLGVRFIDMHLIAACKHYNVELLTRDNKMQSVYQTVMKDKH